MSQRWKGDDSSPFISELADRKSNKNTSHTFFADRITSIGELAATIAHEINQPLTAISNYLNGCILRLQSGNFAVDELLYALNQAMKQAHRTADIIQHMKNFSSKGLLNYTPQCINKLVEELIALMNYETVDNPVTINFHPAATNPVIVLDKVYIQHVILNLIRNAVEVMLEAKVTDPVLTIEVMEIHDGFIKICILNQGMKTSTHNIHPLFHSGKYTEIEQALAINRIIIEAHGGELIIEANSDGGTNYQFTLSAHAKALK